MFFHVSFDSSRINKWLLKVIFILGESLSSACIVAEMIVPQGILDVT